MSPTFSRYQVFVIAVLAFIQFTIVLDFMILSPLGALLLDQLHITTAQFGLVVSAYAFSAGASGLLAAGYADRFDRKRLLLFFYAGFVLGTLMCGLATTYEFLLAARMITGLFGGVIGSISFAIIADLFPLEVRGRVMGVVQTAFSASQVLGLPIGLYLANLWDWHAPFLMIVAVSAAVGVLLAVRLQPIDAHLKTGAPRTAAFSHLLTTVSKRRYLTAFMATMLLATGGFMLMPFGSAFTVRNMGIPLNDLPLVYMLTGAASIVAGPLMGRLSDQYGKYRLFAVGTIFATLVVLFYTRLGITPLWVVISINVVLFIFLSARMVSASALTSGVPEMKDRGAFMAVSASLQQLSGGVAAWVAGLIVIQAETGPLERYEVLGYVVGGAMLITVPLMFFVHRTVAQAHPAPAPMAPAEAA